MLEPVEGRTPIIFDWKKTKSSLIQLLSTARVMLAQFQRCTLFQFVSCPWACPPIFFWKLRIDPWVKLAWVMAMQTNLFCDIFYKLTIFSFSNTCGFKSNENIKQPVKIVMLIFYDMNVAIRNSYAILVQLLSKNIALPAGWCSYPAHAKRSPYLLADDVFVKTASIFSAGWWIRTLSQKCMIPWWFHWTIKQLSE